MSRLGIIKKIEIKDFITYNYVEFYPGPNLNLILGPNGTGKSTIVAAIILGLGGNPKVIGRGSKVSEYVKYGCSQSKINIFLEDSNNKYLKITRVMTNLDKSSWLINNENSTLKDVLNVVKQYNIQVDNLCQFLAQDRVQDFAKMNQQELLKATQLALGRNDLIETQQKLIGTAEKFKQSDNNLNKNRQKLQQQIDLNAHLDGKMASFQKKQEYLKKIGDIDRKVSWIQYDEINKKLSETKADMDKAKTIYEKYKKQSEPIVKSINDTRKIITELQAGKSNIFKSNRSIESSIRTQLDRIKDLEQTISDALTDRDIELAAIDEKENEIEASKQKIVEMKQRHQDLSKQYDDAQIIRNKTEKLNGEIQKLRQHQRNINEEKNDLLNNRQDHMAEFRACENELLRLENIRQKRLDHLKRIDNDAYEGVLWLRNHRDLFQGDIYEPMILEVNMFDPNKAKYVENTIPLRDRVAFTCTLKEDMNLMIHHLRIQKKLKVNILHTPIDPNQNHQPRIPIERLQRYGFYAYMNTLFTLSDAVMQYLCNTYHINEIPVGDDNVDRCYDQLPNDLRVFFSGTLRYTINVSKYSGEKITTQNQIRSDGSFSVNIDILRIQNLKAKRDELQIRINRNGDSLNELNNQIERINENIAQLMNELKRIENVKQQLQTIQYHIDVMQRNVDQMQNNLNNRDIIYERTTKKIQNTLTSLGLLHKEITTKYQSLIASNHQLLLYDGKIDYSRQQIVIYEQQICESQRLFNESEQALNQIRNKYHDIQAKMKSILNKAKSLSNNCTPDDGGFDEYRSNFQQLPNDLCELENYKQELLDKINLLIVLNDNELREYEERLELIKNLQKNIETDQYQTNQIQLLIDQLKEDWLTPLNQLLSKINLNFSKFFDKIGYCGNVTLNTSEQDFSQYGLLINVSFRKNEPLQALNTITQSGGERAVTTAVFMLALQELTPVPFRCVDEINQGMDPVNERRIFDLIVNSTKETNTAQFFLVTPKLLPNLNFTQSMMVHIVHNGPHVEQDKKWSASQFSNPQRLQIH